MNHLRYRKVRLNILTGLVILAVASCCVSNSAQAQIGTPYWNTEFYVPGVNVGVTAFKADGNSLIVGGQFASAGPDAVISLARYDLASETWIDFGLTDSPGELYAIEVMPDGSVVIAGLFEFVEGIPVQNVARWFDGEWHAMGDGLGDRVRDLLFADGRLFAGGQFTQSGSRGVRHVAEWTGTEWTEVGDGFSRNGSEQLGRIYALEWGDGRLFAGGRFDHVGAAPAESIASWDGGTWSALNGGVRESDTVDGKVYDLEWSHGHLYVSGRFNEAGMVEAFNVARWMGAGWEKLGDSGIDSSVEALTVTPEGNVIATDGRTGSILLPEGESWQSIPDVGGWAHLTNIESTDDGRVFGDFVFITFSEDFFISQSLYELDPDQGWKPVMSSGYGTDGPMLAIEPDGTDGFYVGGRFHFAGTTRARSVAHWTNGGWEAVGDGLPGDVYSLLTDGAGGLYAGGNFSISSGGPRQNVAYWDGAEWSALGSGLTFDPNQLEAYVYSLTVYQDTLFAGGFFNRSGNEEVRYLAKYDATADRWVEAGGNLNGAVRALLVSSDDALVAAGGFSNIGASLPARGIARYHAGVWESLSGNNDTNKYAVLESQGKLYASGNFDGDAVGVFDGNEWTSAGTGIPGTNTVNALCGSQESRIFAAGNFKSNLLAPGYASGDGFIASLTDGTWTNAQLGRILGVAAYDCAVVGSDLFVIGDFYGIASDPYASGWDLNVVSTNIARLVNGSHVMREADPLLPTGSVGPPLNVYPNPSTGTLRVEFEVTTAGQVLIEVFDAIGRQVRKVETSWQGPGFRVETIDVSDVPPGVYFIRSRVGGNSSVKAVSIVRK